MATPTTRSDPLREDLRILAVQAGLTFVTIAIGVAAERLLKYAAKRAETAISKLRFPEPSRTELEGILREQLPDGFVVDPSKPLEWQRWNEGGRTIFLARPAVRYIGPPGQALRGA